MITSIMMNTYNRLDLTKETINDLLVSTTCYYRLIIIDNGSTDGTVEYLQNLKIENSYCQSLDIIYNSINKGIAIGRNQGLNIANKYQDPFLATIDNDVKLPVMWLNDCISIIGNNKISIGVNFEDQSYPLTQHWNGYYYQNKPAGNLGSACMVFPRKLHNDIGFFYGFENLYGEEDADWGFRARQAGYQLGYLVSNGIHLGVGNYDTGEYREWKTACHTKNLIPFQKRCIDIMNKKIPIYVSFVEQT